MNIALSTMQKQERRPSSTALVEKKQISKAQNSMQQQLIKNAQNGDQAAFQELLKQHLPNILSLGYRMLKDKTETEDMAQEVTLKLWQNLNTYDQGRGKLSTWIYRITANQCLDYLRRKRPDQLDENFDAPSKINPHQDLIKKQTSSTVMDALNALPERQRLALILFHYQGHSLLETGEIMECSEEAVESLLARARRTLKTTLKPVWQQMLETE